jgi:hypothetical protein
MAEIAPPPPAPAAIPPTPPPAVTHTAVKETFVDDQGKLRQVDPSERRGALAMGLRPASLAETIQAEKNIAADSAIGKVIAGATGAVPGLTTALVKGAGLYGESSEDAAEAVAHSIRTNEGTHYTGMAASLLIPVGAARLAGVARGAAGATSLARAGAEAAALGGEALGAEAIVGGAEAATAAGETALAATRVGRGLQAARSAALRVGAEGAAFAGAAGADETVLGDPNANGEAVVAGAGRSALWGGILGLSLGGAAGFLGGALGRGARGASGSLSEAMADAERVGAAPEKAFAPGSAAAAKETAAYEARIEATAQRSGVRSEELRAALHEAESAATTATENVVERAETSTATSTGKTVTEGTIKEANSAADDVLKRIFGKNEDAYQAASAIWKERLNSLAVQEGRLDANAAKLVEAGNAALRAENAMQKVAFGEAKAEQMAKLVDPAKWEAAQNSAFSMLQDARAVTSELEGLATKGGSELGVSRVGKALTDAEAKAEALLRATDKGAALRDYFVSLDAVKRTVGKAAEFGKSAVGLSEGAREFEKLYERLRVGMESEAVWGKAGAAQREINAATAEALSTYKKFSRDFVHEYGAEAGRPTFEFRSDAAKSHLSNVLEFAERDKSRGIADWSEGLERRLNAVEKHYGLTPAERAEFGQGREALKKLRETLGEATKDASTISKIRSLQAEERAGAMGGTLGMIGSVFTQPISTVARMGELKVVLNSVTERMTSAAKNIVEKTAGSTTTATREASTAVHYGRAAEEATSASVSATESLTKRREFAVEAMSKVRDMSANPTALAGKISQAISRYDNHAPQTSAAMAATMGRGVGYLASKIPPGGPTQPSLQPLTQKARYSDTEVRDFMDRYSGVQDPLSLLDDMESGRVSRAKVEAVREVYPDLFRKIQTNIGIMAAAQEKPLSWERTKMLAIVFGVPTHPAFDPSFIAAVQAPMQGSAPPSIPAQPSATSRYSARPMNVKPAEYQSPTERMAVGQ